MYYGSMASLHFLDMFANCSIEAGKEVVHVKNGHQGSSILADSCEAHADNVECTRVVKEGMGLACMELVAGASCEGDRGVGCHCRSTQNSNQTGWISCDRLLDATNNSDSTRYLQISIWLST